MRALPFEQAFCDVRADITHPLLPEETLLKAHESMPEFVTSERPG
jgi:hypothetical protein